MSQEKLEVYDICKMDEEDDAEQSTCIITKIAQSGIYVEVLDLSNGNVYGNVLLSDLHYIDKCDQEMINVVESSLNDG